MLNVNILPGVRFKMFIQGCNLGFWPESVQNFPYILPSRMREKFCFDSVSKSKVSLPKRYSETDYQIIRFVLNLE